MIFVINLLVWTALLLFGVLIVESVAAQHVVGFPSSGQESYYVGAPLAMLALSIAYALGARGWFREKCWVPVQALFLLSTFVYLFFYTGGM